VRVRYFICNTPSAYAVISVLRRPVESADESGRSPATASGRTRAYANVSYSAGKANGRFQARRSEAGRPAVDPSPTSTAPNLPRQSRRSQRTPALARKFLSLGTTGRFLVATLDPADAGGGQRANRQAQWPGRHASGRTRSRARSRYCLSIPRIGRLESFMSICISSSSVAFPILWPGHRQNDEFPLRTRSSPAQESGGSLWWLLGIGPWRPAGIGWDRPVGRRKPESNDIAQRASLNGCSNRPPRDELQDIVTTPQRSR